MESNKPKWSDMEDWAEFIACDEDGAWYQYSKEPDPNEVYTHDGLHKWNAGDGCKFSMCLSTADESWADANWETSVEQRPTVKQESSEHYLSAPNARRVTLFIDFDGPVLNDGQLAQNIAEMLCKRLGTDIPYPGNKFSPDGSGVDRIRIAIGKELMNKIAYDTSDGFYVESKEND